MPHRHKFGRRDRPLCSLWRLPDGTERRCTYIESRQYYCHFYAQLVRKQTDFQTLCQWLAGGYNLEIGGFDGWPLTPDGANPTPAQMAAHYNDPSKPFGHEVVLATLLLFPDPKDWPWPPLV